MKSLRHDRWAAEPDIREIRNWHFWQTLLKISVRSSCMFFNVSLCSCRVRLVERGAPQSLPLMESGKVRRSACFRNKDQECVKCAVKGYRWTNWQCVSILFLDSPWCPGDYCQPRDPWAARWFSSRRGEQKFSHPNKKKSFFYLKWTIEPVCSPDFVTDLGEQSSHCQRLLHHLRRGESSGRSLQH